MFIIRKNRHLQNWCNGKTKHLPKTILLNLEIRISFDLKHAWNHIHTGIVGQALKCASLCQDVVTDIGPPLITIYYQALTNIWSYYDLIMYTSMYLILHIYQYFSAEYICNSWDFLICRMLFSEIWEKYINILKKLWRSHYLGSKCHIHFFTTYSKEGWCWPDVINISQSFKHIVAVISFPLIS